ncbi:hypothetical protein QE152_g14196 [Popillia japonica]|uniref:Uncharacterized protein n=1 Tax=Popillia japonica TaxID=7064 RepID=A0AAW1L7I6_POPJA
MTQAVKRMSKSIKTNQLMNRLDPNREIKKFTKKKMFRIGNHEEEDVPDRKPPTPKKEEILHDPQETRSNKIETLNANDRPINDPSMRIGRR